MLALLGAACGPAPQAEPVPAQQPAGQAAAEVELAPMDVTLVRRAPLVDELPITGTLTATRTAVLRANVAALVQEVTVRVGDTVQAGQVVARLDDSEYRTRQRQARQNLAAAQAQLDIAKRTLRNNEALVSQGFISRNALETAQANADNARAQVGAAQAAVDLAGKAVADTVLRAPMGGVVSQRLVQVGERVGIDGRVLELIDLSEMELQAAISAQRVLMVPLGAPAQLQVEGRAQPVAARVARLSPGTQAGTRAVTAYLSIEDPTGLRHGLFARGSIELARRTASVIPASAVRLSGSRPQVLVIEQGQVVLRDVRTGLRGRVDGAEAVEILDGLVEGERVLQASAGDLRPGTRVTLPPEDQPNAQPKPQPAEPAAGG